MLAISCILIAAAGYLINDLYDRKIDIINKPSQLEPLSKNVILVLYTVLNITALVISYIYATPVLFTLFPISIFLLWIYSALLKKLPLVGNIIIAVLSGIIPIIYLFAQNEFFTDCQTPLSQINTTEIIFHFSILAFLSTLSREIVKDIEDIKGDQAEDLKTLPIVIGVNAAKYITLLFILITLTWLIYFIKNQTEFNLQNIAFWIAFLGSFLPLIVSIVILITAANKKKFNQISTLIKISMIGFLLFIIAIALNQ